MPRTGPLTPIFRPEPKKGAAPIGHQIGTPITRARPSTVTLPTSIPTPVVTATSPQLTVIGSVTDALLNGVGFIIVDTVNGDAYLTSPSDDRLVKCDVSTPASPTVTGSRASSTTLDSAMGLAQSGNYVFVVARLDNCLTSNDITGANPAFADNVVSVTDLQNPTDVAIVGSTAFVTAQIGSADDKLTSVDISDPLNMTIISTVQSALFNLATAVVAEGNHAYVISDTQSDTLAIVDISNPASMSVVGSVTDGTNLNAATGLCKDGDIVYVVTTSTTIGVASVDVSDVNNPVVLDHIAITSANRGVCKIGDMLFVARAASNAISVIDASDPSNLAAVTALVDATNLGGVADLTTDGTYIYAAVSGQDRLTILEYA